METEIHIKTKKPLNEAKFNFKVNEDLICEIDLTTGFEKKFFENYDKDWRVKIKKLLKKQKLTQKRFCNETGIHPTKLSLVLNKQRIMKVSTAIALEAYSIGTADYWMACQIKEQIDKERSFIKRK